MAPELLNTIDAKELKGLAQRVREYQEGKKLSDNGLYRKFPGIGSTTTYKRILDGKLEELDLERQLSQYRAVVALIESIRDEDDEEELFEDLLPALEIKRSFLETSGRSSNDRFIVVEGDTGSGKTGAGKLLVRKYGSRFLYLEACDVWGDKPGCLMAAILVAMGIRNVPINLYDRQEMVVARLNESRICVIIDEAHHLGPHCLNTIKTLINRTPGEFIALAMRTLWGRLERDNYQEVKQLTGNRLSERIKLSLREGDVKKLLDRRLEGLDSDTKQAVVALMKFAPMHGNLAFVRNVIRRAREQAGKDAVGIDILNNSIQAEVNRR